MVVTLMVPARAYFGLKHLVTIRHLDNMNKILLATGCIVAYSYVIEFFMAWYGGNIYEQFAVANRAMGPYAWAFWLMVFCNVVAPQLFWFKKWRTTPALMIIVAILVNVGMWFERFVIIVASLNRDFLPSSWFIYIPDLGRSIDAGRQFRLVFHVVSSVLPLLAHGGRARGEASAD